MKQFKLLLSLQLKEYISFFNRKKISKGQKMLFILLFLLVTALAIFSTLSTAATFIYPLIQVDRLYLLLPIMMLVTMIIIFLIAAKRIKAMVFLANDIDFLKTLPIKPSYIILSKLLVFYLLSVILTLILLIGTDVLLLIIANESIASLLVNILFSFFMPILPIILATIVILPLSILAKYYRTSKITKILDIFFSFIILTSLLLFLTLAPLMNENHINILGNIINSFFYTYLYKIALELNFYYIIMFIIIKLLLLSLYLIFLNKYYYKIHSIISKKDRKNDYQTKYLKNNDISKVLFRKELKLYKSTNGYVMNTIIFTIMIAMTAVVLVTLRFIGMLDTLFDSEYHNLIIISLLPSILLFNSFVATTTFSISLEGQNLYLLKVLPIDLKKVIDAKIKLHVIMLGIIPAISTVLIGISLDIGIIYSLMFGLIILLHSYFIANFGMIINFFYPKINFKSEISVIKNSLATILMMLYSQLLLIPVLAPFILLSINDHFHIALLILTITIVIILIIARMFVVKKGVSLLNRIN